MAAPDFSLGSSSTFIAEELPMILSRNSAMGSQFSTDISIANAGVEHRSGLWSSPLANVDLGPGVRTMQTLRALDVFWRRVYGPRDAFLFHNPKWHTTAGYAGIKDKIPGPISPTDDIIGTGDGVLTQFQFVKASGNAVQNIFKIKGTPQVALNGVPQNDPGDYSFDANGLITFTSAPGGGVSITAGFDYFIVVRFMDDTLDLNFQNYMRGIATVLLKETRDFG